MLLAACWLGFGLRVLRLDAQPFWFDEWLTFDLTLALPGHVLATIDRPPLYYLLTHAWTSVAGATPFALRFFSVWWGVLALPLLYRLGQRLIGQRAGAVGMLLATLAPFYIYYAQEARTYTLTLTLALASSVALLAWLDGGKARYLILHGMATLACLYTHYTALLVPLTHAAFVLLAYRARRHLVLPALTAQLVIGALFAPWPLHVRDRLPELAAPRTELLLFTHIPPVQRTTHVVWTTLAEFSAGRVLSSPIADGVGLLFLFLLILGAISPHLSTWARCFLLAELLLPLAALLILPRTAVYFSPKYLMVATPAFYLLVVAGLRTLQREARWLFWLFLLLVALAAAWGSASWFTGTHIKVA